MKKILSLLTMTALLAGVTTVSAQTIKLTSYTNDSVVDMAGSQKTLVDDNSQAGGGYEAGKDYHITFTGGCTEPRRMAVRVKMLKVGCLDTVYIYDGPTATGTPIIKFNSFTNNVKEGDYIFESPSNTTGSITIRFVTDPLTDPERTALACYANNTQVNEGFELSIECRSTCATSEPVLDEKFYRTRNGVVFDSAFIHEIILYDTIYNIPNDPTSGVKELVESDRFMGANLCIGDGVIFTCHGVYTNVNSYYTPKDETSYFHWDMDFEGDTMGGYGLTEISYAEYQRTGCYDIRLNMTDEKGCESSITASFRVRTAQNPIKTLYSLDHICNRDSLTVYAGYDGDNATLTLARIKSDSAVSKSFVLRTFIPDGQCDGQYYYEAPVTFQEFSNSRTVEKASDICSICVNMEHSYMGDIYITIVCPTNKEAILKFGSHVDFDPPYEDPTLPVSTTNPGGNTGTSTTLGLPIARNLTSNMLLTGDDWSNICDSTKNPYGIGLDYCFSRDTGYTLVTGHRAGDVWDFFTPHPAGNFYIGETGAPKKDYTITLPAIPDGFAYAGTVPLYENNKHSTRRPSDRNEKKNYYLPYSTFSELIGCPLNGTWKMRVYDTKKKDNGWIFGWSMDICDFQASACDYQVGIDSLIWEPDPDPQYHDYDLGHYRGAEVHRETPLKSYILTPDTSGTFPILVHVYDEFGCQWDTSTHITSIWTPKPNLGPDTALCGINQMLLDANDQHSKDPTQGYSYKWEPLGLSTDTITTIEEPGGSVTYIVEVTNTMVIDDVQKQCVTRDTIIVGNRRQPLPSVLPTPFVFEGCDPFTLQFNNQSIDADEHLWIFGDGTTSSEASPTHTYTEGIYDLKYYATSSDGCIDSIISPGAVAVFSSPKAAFSWAPTYPSVTNPTVQFNNETTPKTANTRYFWEMQYDLNNPLSVDTKTDENPFYNFTRYADGNPAGNYSVRLIARTDNEAPTGNMVYCADTALNNILVVNDFLQFPNVVTPNGDGINDRFEIVNLADGLAYPINSLDIYNKWGSKVYHKDNISNVEDFWDPSNVPDGTYYFHFTARGYNGSIEHNGVIEVMR